MLAVQNTMGNFRVLVFLCGALAFLLFAGSIGAQQKPSNPQPPGAKPSPTPTPADDQEVDEVVRVTSNLVVVPVSVTDAAGQPVLGLKTTDFRLEEEGRQQEIAQIGDPEQVPLDIAVLFDISLSVEARFDFEKEAASRFLKQVMKPGDRATIFTIGTVPRLEQALDTSERASARLIAIQQSKGATAF
jgi:Ca-activated chloride channel homolog